jgi:glycosyltransferase involved in cell wall biosynthesis
MPPRESPRVGYVLKMYPRLSETFILSEILAHEAAGLPLEIFSLRAPIDGRFHEGLSRVQARVQYLPGDRLKPAELWSAVQSIYKAEPGLLERFAHVPRHDSVNTAYQGLMLAAEVRRLGITHLHAHFANVAAATARIASCLTGVPYSITAHAKDIFHCDVDGEALRRQLRDASAVVTVSDYNVRFLRDAFGENAAAVQRIYNGVDLDRFPYRAPAERGPLILGTGRLVEKKGFDVLLRACAILAGRHREFHCELIGDGELRPQLERQIVALGLDDRVTMRGALPQHEVIARVREAAALAAPCVVAQDDNRDGLPTVLIEAMALGTPCVSTDVTGIPEILRDGETGLLVGQNDPEGLAAALERLLDDAQLRVRLAEEARRLVESDFDIDRNTARQRTLFGRTASSPPRAVSQPHGVS